MKLLLKILLLPFSVLYGLITFLRNKFYDWGLFESETFDIPVICVGNINTGGTGKSPAVEYLIRLLQKQNKYISTLSRGYGRETKGFILAGNSATAASIGDEPFQFFRKFQNIRVAVCEDRVEGIHLLLEKQPVPEVILLDDAFQHRSVKPGLNILLTDYNHLYSRDWVLPAGRLREFRCGAKRADIIIVTKSPENISDAEKTKIIHSLKPQPTQCVLFSFIRYQGPQPFYENSFQEKLPSLKDHEIVLFSGIADPEPLIAHLKPVCKKLHTLRFSDHHSYSRKDIITISEKFRNIVSENKIILTTEKDFSRLIHQNICNELSDFPVYYLPVEMDFSETDKKTFELKILNYVEKNQ
ncbi:MAG TPA: tetraacyldisaccharide 4'-kinase [Bacteroidales bacterium]|nr:tetraacyldisaccharide 4'-kinase [Bacteroidales bacterium]